MRAVHHGLLSLAAGTILALATRSLAEGLACLGSGLLWDLDHLYDYLRHVPRRNSWPDLVDVCEKGRLERLVLPLHSWELVGSLVLLTWAGAGRYCGLAGLTLGAALHLASDQWANPVQGAAYFFWHRWRHGFRREFFFRPHGEPRPAAD